MKSLYKKWKALIIKYVEMVRGKISRQDRGKLVALVTIEVHARDILDQLQATKVDSPSDFLWTQQLRFYWDQAGELCNIRQNHAFIWSPPQCPHLEPANQPAPLATLTTALTIILPSLAQYHPPPTTLTSTRDHPSIAVACRSTWSSGSAGEGMQEHSIYHPAEGSSA